MNQPAGVGEKGLDMIALHSKAGHARRRRPFGGAIRAGRAWAVAWSLALLVALGPLALAAPALAQQGQVEVAPEDPVGGNVPGGHLGTNSDSEIWRALRQGEQATVSGQNPQAGVLIQSEGDTWRAWRDGPLLDLGAWFVLGFLCIVAIFFAVRGRIYIDSGWSGRTIERFNGVERFAHWLTATCFIVLALTGLNLLYGKHLLMPLIGKSAFGLVTQYGKLAHNYLSFGFMLGIVLMFVLWVVHNLPSRHDFVWIAKGGGLFSKGTHPPAKKFNAGQKLIFWSVMLGGVSLSLSGIALLFPFQFAMFDKTFVVLNQAFGLGLPEGLSAMQEQQLQVLWHSIVALVLIGIVIAHIYIGSLGMEGAFAAMGSGQVDENWAREHHSIWVEEKIREEEARHDENGEPQAAE